MVLPPERRLVPTSALIATRIAYAFNWYNVGAVLPLVGAEFHAGPAALGVVLGAFLVGVGVFQVPAGILTLRWGARRVSLLGVAILGSACVASGFSASWPELAGWRFVGGVGAAFFFSPALSLVASYFPPGSRGPIIGLYNGGFSIGGAAGLFLGALVGGLAGWRWALVSGGVALLAVTAIDLFLLPDEAATPVAAPRAKGPSVVRSILTSRSVWCLALGLTGFWSAIYIVAQYFVDFGQRVHGGWPPGLAAALAALVVLISFPAGPFGGWLGERSRDPRSVLLTFGLLTAALTAVVPFLPLGVLTVDLIGLGITDGVVFAVLYLLPTLLPETKGEGLALGVAVVNSIQVGLGSLLAVVFGALVQFSGYTTAWLYAGLLTLGLLPLLFLVRGTRSVETSR